MVAGDCNCTDGLSVGCYEFFCAYPDVLRPSASEGCGPLLRYWFTRFISSGCGSICCGITNPDGIAASTDAVCVAVLDVFQFVSVSRLAYGAQYSTPYE